VDRAPDTLRGDGQVEVFDPEFGERVDHRVDDRAPVTRRKSSRRTDLPMPSGAELVREPRNDTCATVAEDGAGAHLVFRLGV
jgi:hypothetical protein